MNRNLTLLLILFFLGCYRENNLNILFDKADGLEVSSKVLLNGVEIGQVDEISLNNDFRILVTCKLKELINIPVDSKVIMMATDLFGTRSIYIQPGTSSKKYYSKDTLQGIVEENHLLDTIWNIGSQQVKDAMDVYDSKIDTLSNELKQMNEFLKKKE